MTDELKNALENAHTEEEKKAVAEKFKNQLMELSDEELAGVAGGKIIDPSGVRFWPLGDL